MPETLEPVVSHTDATTPTPSSSLPPTPTPSPKHTFTWLFMLALLVFAAISGYLFWQNRSLSHQLALAPSPTPDASTQTDSGDHTTDWKTYMNDKFGFSIKYPPYAKTTSRDPDPFPIAIQIDNLQKRTNGGGGPGVTGWLITISEPQANPLKLSLSEWGKEKNLTKNMDANTGAIISITPTTTQISSYPAITWRGPETFRYYIVQKSKTQNVFILVNEGESTEEINTLIDQILSTFKFTGDENSNSDPNIKTFTSEKLGITFQYQEKYKDSNEVISTKEVGNKVYLYSNNMKPDQGQYVEIFDKNPQDDLVTAIQKTVMQGYSIDDCPIRLTGKNITSTLANTPPNYVPAQIGLPASATENGMENVQQYLDKCPQPYVSFGGLAYFITDQNHPSKFAFFSIGQYALNGGDNITWQDTFKFTN